MELEEIEKQIMGNPNAVIQFSDKYNLRNWRVGHRAIRFWLERDELSLCSPITLSMVFDKNEVQASKSFYCKDGLFFLPLELLSLDGLSERVLVGNADISYISLVEYDEDDIISRNEDKHEVRLRSANLIITCKAFDYPKQCKEAEEGFRKIKEQLYWLQKKEEWLKGQKPHLK